MLTEYDFRQHLRTTAFDSRVDTERLADENARYKHALELIMLLEDIDGTHVVSPATIARRALNQE